MCKAAHAAIALCRFLIIDEREGMRAAAARFDAEALEERPADEVRRLPAHVADADVDARLTKEHRLELRVSVREMQNADVAELPHVIKIVVGGHCSARRNTKCCSRGEIAQESPAIQFETLPWSARRRYPRVVQRIMPARHASSCSFACAIDASAKAWA